MNTYHLIVRNGVAMVEAESAEEAYKKCGYKFTGHFDSLGRFEIVRQPEGVYGAKATWQVWDHTWKDIQNGTPWETLKSAKLGIEAHANDVIQRETEYDARTQDGDELESYPDRSSFWKKSGKQWNVGGN
jgi:hypothetical protein